jgi:hypothetical protein
MQVARLPRLLALASLLFLAAWTYAQRGTAASDSLRSLLAQQRAAVLAADSAGAYPPRVEQRLALADLLPPTRAVELLWEAAALADSSHSLPLRLRVQDALARSAAGAGQHKTAYDAALAARQLQTDLARQEADSLRTALGGQLADSARAMNEAVLQMAGLNAALTIEAQAQRVRAERWAWGALTVGLLLLVAVFLLLRRLRRLNRRTQSALATLQQQVDELKEFRNRRRETPPAPATPRPAPDPPAPPAPVDVDAAMDPVVAALFRKQGPDRLQALRAARASSDQDKVLRVVHSLKPQLAGFDAERFIPLCARITTPSAMLDARRWNADLDVLERGVESVLERLAQ